MNDQLMRLHLITEWILVYDTTVPYIAYLIRYRIYYYPNTVLYFTLNSTLPEYNTIFSMLIHQLANEYSM